MQKNNPKENVISGQEFKIEKRFFNKTCLYPIFIRLRHYSNMRNIFRIIKKIVTFGNFTKKMLFILTLLLYQKQNKKYKSKVPLPLAGLYPKSIGFQAMLKL